MSLKVVLFDFNGVIVNDESIHKSLLDEALLSENLRPEPDDYKQLCLGRSDRASLTSLLQKRGRSTDERSLERLIHQKAIAYQQRLEGLPKIPVYPGVEDLIYKLRVAKIRIGLVTEALRTEAEWVLNRVNLWQYFEVIVGGDETSQSKPDPQGYDLAIDRFNQLDPSLKLVAQECLAIEDTPVGILSAKSAGITVVGVANTYPFHMIQRQANWTVDYLHELEVDRVRQVLAGHQEWESINNE